MRRLIVNMFLTLDGVLQAPGGPGEDVDAGFQLGGWSVNYWDDLMGEVMGEWMSSPFDLLLGRRTYDLFAAYWPQVNDEDGGRGLNAATKYVVSRGAPALPWQPAVLISADPVSADTSVDHTANTDLVDHAALAIKALKAQDGPELQVHGSGNLIQTLLHHSLVDELRLWTFPLVVGPGKRLFADGTIPIGLKLIESKISTTGVVIGRYVPAGDIVTGTF